MSKTTPKAPVKKWGGRLAGSRPIIWIMNLPPIAWAARGIARDVVKRQLGERPILETEMERVAGINLKATLEQIVYDVVDALGYAGAMVTTYEQGDSLPVRALYVDPNLATNEQIHQWESKVSSYSENPASITDPEIARVFVYQEECQDNLSVQAFKAGKPVSSNDLYDLFIPIAPPASRPIVKGIQQALGIHQVIAIPFFLETLVDGRPEKEIVGNLFAAKRGPISRQDELILSAFGRQVAAAIESERRRLQIKVAQRLVLEMQSSLQDEKKILQQIAGGLVLELGYAGTLVAIYQPDGALSARVFCIDPNLASDEQVGRWESEVSEYSGHPTGISDPEIARVLVHQDECEENLGVRAFKAGRPVSSDDLYDLFTPIASPASRPIVKQIQKALGIQQIIAVPFFRERLVDGQLEKDFVGILVATTRSKKFSGGEIELLQAFGQQAALGIQNAQLYRQVEERRRVAQIFGRMAFSATASVHALRNHISAFRMYLHLLQIAPPEQLGEILKSNARVIARLDEAVDILDNLHQPWCEAPDAQTDINICLIKTIGKVVPNRDGMVSREGIVVRESLAEGLPAIRTSPHKLAEAFKVLVENALDAIREKGQGGELRVESWQESKETLNVLISDSGMGIRPENVGKVFELQWSTKNTGMGFGLFWTKEYIEGLGGSIRVESVWQEGTTFTINLPISSECQEEQEEGKAHQ